MFCGRYTRYSSGRYTKYSSGRYTRYSSDRYKKYSIVAGTEGLVRQVHRGIIWQEQRVFCGRYTR
jgi:hypothetical protein